MPIAQQSKKYIIKYISKYKKKALYCLRTLKNLTFAWTVYNIEVRLEIEREWKWESLNENW